MAIVSKPKRTDAVLEGSTPSQMYQEFFDDLEQQLNDNLLNFRVQLISYAVADVPTASPAGGLIYVSDEAGGAVPAFSDGINWRRVTDRTIVS